MRNYLVQLSHMTWAGGGWGRGQPEDDGARHSQKKVNFVFAYINIHVCVCVKSELKSENIFTSNTDKNKEKFEAFCMSRLN